MGLRKEGLVMIYFDNDDFRKRYNSFKDEIKNTTLKYVVGVPAAHPEKNLTR